MTAKNFRVKHGLDVGDVQNVITIVGDTPTFTGTVASAGSTQGNITIGIETDNTITTTTGTLTIDSADGEVYIQQNLNVVSGTLLANTITTYDSTAIDINTDLNVNGNLGAGGIQISDGVISADSSGISFSGLRLQDVLNPVEVGDAANKGYVDDIVPTFLNDLTNVDADATYIQDGDLLAAPLTDSSTNIGFSLTSQQSAGIRIPSGTTAQRPVVYEGVFRLNSETNKYEGSIDGTNFQEFLVSEIILNSDVDSAIEQVDSFVATTYRAVEYMYTVENSGTGEYQTGKIMVVHDGTTAYHSEYGKVITGNNDLVTFTTGLSSGSVLLYASAQTPNSVFKAKRISMEVA